MSQQLDMLKNVGVGLSNTGRDRLARIGKPRGSRQALLCLLCVLLGICVVAMLWTVVESFKPTLAQSENQGSSSSNATAQLGPGKRAQLPAIDNEHGWETLVQVQNVGTTDTGVVMFFWGSYSSKCPTNDPGPLDTACMRVPKDGVWTLKAVIPTQAKSAIAYSVAMTAFDEACEDARDAVGNTSLWQAWEDTYAGTGEPLAVIVQRWGPNDFGITVSSAYPGLTEPMQGEGPPYQYFTPYAMRRYHNLYTEMVIQNGGDQCTPVSIYYKEQGRCPFQQVQRIEQLAPGESVRLRVPDYIKCEWLGSAYVQANQPLGIIVDQISYSRYCPNSEDRGTLLTYWAQPYKPAGDTLVYATLLFRMWVGWQTGIQVQNLTKESLPTFVTVNFMDSKGNELLFVGDWICPNGASTFFVPAIADLGPEYVGAADIQSHKQVDYPSGQETDGQPIFAVVDVKKVLIYSDMFGWMTAPPGEAQGGCYNAAPLSVYRGWGYFALPSISKTDEMTSTIAIRNNSNCNRIQLRINLYDSTGTKQTVISNLWLKPKQLQLVDLASITSVASGFIGAGVVEVIGEEQLCDTNGDGRVDPEVVIPSVVVLNKGRPTGDITTTYEGIPFKKWGLPCRANLRGKVIDDNTRVPLKNVKVTVPNGWYITATETYTDAIGTTRTAGMYEIEGIATFETLEPQPGTCYTITASVDGYFSSVIPKVCLHCGEDKMLNFSLICNSNTITGTVTQYATPGDSGPPVAGATVTTKWAAYSHTDDPGEAITTTNASGYYELKNLPKEVEIEITISREGYDVVTATHKFTGLTCNEKWEFSPVLKCWAKIIGIVWNDANGDGDLDPGEPVIAGQTVNLYTDGQTKLLDSTTTNEYGQYSFAIGKDLFAPGDFDWGNTLDVGVGTAITDTVPIWPCTINVYNFGL